MELKKKLHEEILSDKKISKKSQNIIIPKSKENRENKFKEEEVLEVKKRTKTKESKEPKEESKYNSIDKFLYNDLSNYDTEEIKNIVNNYNIKIPKKMNNRENGIDQLRNYIINHPEKFNTESEIEKNKYKSLEDFIIYDIRHNFDKDKILKMMNDNNIKYHKNNGLPKLREKVINWLKQDENNYNLVYKKNKKNNLIYNIQH